MIWLSLQKGSALAEFRLTHTETPNAEPSRGLIRGLVPGLLRDLFWVIVECDCYFRLQESPIRHRTTTFQTVLL